jgi:hypothetical protein
MCRIRIAANQDSFLHSRQFDRSDNSEVRRSPSSYGDIETLYKSSVLWQAGISLSQPGNNFG